jgi:hypothetical protein
MPRRFAERGEGNLGCILWVAVLGLAVLIAVKMVPVKIAASELYDYMEKQARADVPTDAIVKGIVGRAKELELPVTKDDVQVERVLAGGGGDYIKMHAVFTVPVEFPGYTYMWHFDHQVNRPIYIF